MVHHSELTPLIWEISAVDDKLLINISWSLDSTQFLSTFTIHTGCDMSRIYLLTISHGSSSQVISLNESSYNFTAPEGTPPCEVYNFSVTATKSYVGATYTGAGCSVPSPVLSSMLPSLPDTIGDTMPTII